MVRAERSIAGGRENKCTARPSGQNPIIGSLTLTGLTSAPAEPRLILAHAAGGDSKRRFLAYDLVGCVTCRQEEGCQVVEVLFHDQRGRQRVPHLSDYFGFTMAALGSKARPHPQLGSVRKPITFKYDDCLKARDFGVQANYHGPSGC